MKVKVKATEAARTAVCLNLITRAFSFLTTFLTSVAPSTIITMPPTPTITTKLHVCSQCKKAFNASYKLDNHLAATKHVLCCTKPGCTTTRITGAGLATHIADDHSAGAQSATPASVVQTNSHTASDLTSLFLCTEGNCNKNKKGPLAASQYGGAWDACHNDKGTRELDGCEHP